MTMRYKGYIGKVEYDDEAGLFHGDVLLTRGVVTFQGRSVDELRTAFQESVDDYLVLCAQEGIEPEPVFSGRFVVRVSPEVHREAALAARQAGKSLNTWAAEALTQAARR